MNLDDARRAIPRIPLCLGLAGLIPFWGLSLSLSLPALSTVGIPTVVALQIYAAIIISFLGGIRWGLATAAPQAGIARHYGIAVLPSLLAWACLALPQPWSLAGLGALALALGLVDQDLVRTNLAPPWFGRLRLVLSTGAGIALISAAITLLPR